LTRTPFGHIYNGSCKDVNNLSTPCPFGRCRR